METQTSIWLQQHGLDNIPLKMRPSGDYQSDVYLKRFWLSQLDKNPTLVFDDRDSVVQMWRDNGIVCCQVAPGGF